MKLRHVLLLQKIFDREGFWPQKSSRMKSVCCQRPVRGADRRRTVERTDEGHDDWRVSRPYQWFDFARGTGLLIVTGSRPSLPLYIHPGVHSVRLIICSSPHSWINIAESCRPRGVSQCDIISSCCSDCNDCSDRGGTCSFLWSDHS